MPFVSKAQRKWMYANKPEMAKEWEKETPKGKKLPNHVKKHKKQFGGSMRGVFEEGGEKKVDKAPPDYTFDREENGRKYYTKKSSSRGIAVAKASQVRGGDEYERFLQQQLGSGVSPEELVAKKYLASDRAAGYSRYYKPMIDTVYTEAGQMPVQAPQAPQINPAYAGRGEAIYMPNKHIAGEIYYNSRNSKNVADAGILNTAPQSAHIRFRNDFDYDGTEVDLEGPDIQKYLGTTHTFPTGDLYNELRNRNKLTKKALGGMTAQQAYKTIFDDEDNKSYIGAIKENTAPSEEEVQTQMVAPEEDQADLFSYMRSGDEGQRRSFAQETYNPYKQAKAAFQSMGKYGTQNISPVGQQIASELSQDLGYAPKFNSIYRDPTQQAALVKQGVGVKNSYHLTGSAVDMSPSDWANLSPAQQKKYRSRYDVISHNNHVHLEPKG